MPRIAAALLVPVIVAHLGNAASARAGAQRPRLSAIERRIAGRVDARNHEAEALLARVVDINSGTMNFEGVRQVGAVFRAELDRLGFRTRWVDGASFHRAGHLVAERSGRGPGLLLIGHLDTVFERDSPFQRFERLSGNRARGPGVIDMKGGDVIIVAALEALRAEGVLEGMRIVVFFSGDEEKAGDPLDEARRELVAIAGRSDVALGFEDGAGKPDEAVTARRGASNWNLHVGGTPAHSSQIFRDDVGAGAIFEAARILDGFYRALAGQRYLTLSPGAIVGGTTAQYDPAQNRGTAFGKDNVVAGTAVVEGDLRTVSPEQLSSAKERMRSIVADHLPLTEAGIEFHDGYPPMAPSEGNRRLLALYDGVSRDIGLGPVAETDPMHAGAADVAFAAGHVKMAIDGIGLCGSDDHTDRETADLSTLSGQTRRAAVLIYRLTR